MASSSSFIGVIVVPRLQLFLFNTWAKCLFASFILSLVIDRPSSSALGASASSCGPKSRSRASSSSSVVPHLRRLFGRERQLLSQGRVREVHPRHRLFAHSSLASFSASGSKSSPRASSTSMIVHRRRIIGCYLIIWVKFYLSSLWGVHFSL